MQFFKKLKRGENLNKNTVWNKNENSSRDFKTKIGRLINESFFLRIFFWLANFFYNKILHSKIAQFLSSYFSAGKWYDKSLSKKIITKLWFTPEKRLNAKNKVQELFENALFYKIYLMFINCLLSLKARVYGVVFFIYGFCAASVGLIKTFVAESVNDDYNVIMSIQQAADERIQRLNSEISSLQTRIYNEKQRLRKIEQQKKGQ